MSYQPIPDQNEGNSSNNLNNNGAYVSFADDIEQSSGVSFITTNNNNNNKFTANLLGAALIACLSAFQFGYHTGELNNPKDIFTHCYIPNSTATLNAGWFSNLPSCVSLTEFEFSLVTSVFPLGGILGSLFAGSLMDKFGRKGSLVWNNLFLVLGSLIMTLTVDFYSMLFGRVLVGIAGGIALVIVPVYLSEVAPAPLRGSIGIFNQLSIVFGILTSQFIGLIYSTITTWRYILAVGLFVSFLQLAGFTYYPETPVFLINKTGGYRQAEESLRFLRQSLEVDDELTELGIKKTPSSPNAVEYGTNSPPPSSVHTEGDQSSYSIAGLFQSQAHRTPLLFIMFIHLTQQMSGISAVMYYSTEILKTNFGDKANIVTVLINVVQFLVTVGTANFVDNWGRRKLLILSTALMGTFSALLAFSINLNLALVSALALFLSIGSFSIGTGPLPFVLATELFDSKAIAAASSIALTTNLALNCLVATMFLPVKQLFPASQPGSVFFIFAIWLGASSYFLYRVFPETKASTPTVNADNLKTNVARFFNKV